MFSNTVIAEKVTVFDFTEKEFKTLKVGKKYKGETTWTLGSNQNGNFIKAEAEGINVSPTTPAAEVVGTFKNCAIFLIC